MVVKCLADTGGYTEPEACPKLKRAARNAGRGCDAPVPAAVCADGGLLRNTGLCTQGSCQRQAGECPTCSLLAQTWRLCIMHQLPDLPPSPMRKSVLVLIPSFNLCFRCTLVQAGCMQVSMSRLFPDCSLRWWGTALSALHQNGWRS